MVLWPARTRLERRGAVRFATMYFGRRRPIESLMRAVRVVPGRRRSQAWLTRWARASSWVAKDIGLRSRGCRSFGLNRIEVGTGESRVGSRSIRIHVQGIDLRTPRRHTIRAADFAVCARFVGRLLNHRCFRADLNVEEESRLNLSRVSRDTSPWRIGREGTRRLRHGRGVRRRVVIAHCSNSLLTLAG